MGAQQVLRAAAVGVALCAAAPAGADVPRPTGAAGRADESIIIVDLRPGDPAALVPSRKILAEELGKFQGIAVLRPADLDGALSGAAVDQDAGRVATALAAAREAFGALDCARASASADQAIDDLSARQAAGLDDGPALRSAYAYILLCADRAGDVDATIRAAARLRRLGVTSGTDVGISDSTWTHLPEIDATGGEIVAVTVTADLAGAAVWIDHAPAGTSPVTAYLPAGEHVIAAGKSERRAATRVAVSGAAQAVALTLTDQSGPWSAVAGLIRAWRDGATSADAVGLATVMTLAKVRFAVVLAGAHTAEVWSKGRHDDTATKIDSGAIDQPLELAAIITDRVAAMDGRAPDPDRELLTETPEERAALYGGTKHSAAKWYVYASIAGAIVVGGAIIYAKDSATDHQRIVIHGP